MKEKDLQEYRDEGFRIYILPYDKEHEERWRSKDPYSRNNSIYNTTSSYGAERIADDDDISWDQALKIYEGNYDPD